jgi:hypothetical protein
MIGVTAPSLCMHDHGSHFSFDPALIGHSAIRLPAQFSARANNCLALFTGKVCRSANRKTLKLTGSFTPKLKESNNEIEEGE